MRATPTSGPAPLMVTFYNGSTAHVSPVTYTWRFGDGSITTTTGLAQQVVHEYAATGVYSELDSREYAWDENGNLV